MHQSRMDRIEEAIARDSCVMPDDVAALLEEHDRMLDTLKQVERMNREALPKFNWGASFLDANAIRLLNEVPLMVSKTLSELEDL